MIDLDTIKAENAQWRNFLSDEHGQLVEKSFVDALSAHETQRLAEVRQQIDRVDTIDALVVEVERLRSLIPVNTKSERPPFTVADEDSSDLARSLLKKEEPHDRP